MAIHDLIHFHSPSNRMRHPTSRSEPHGLQQPHDVISRSRLRTSSFRRRDSCNRQFLAASNRRGMPVNHIYIACPHHLSKRAAISFLVSQIALTLTIYLSSSLTLSLHRLTLACKLRASLSTSSVNRSLQAVDRQEFRALRERRSM
jgi:hypothetical protein